MYEIIAKYEECARNAKNDGRDGIRLIKIKAQSALLWRSYQEKQARFGVIENAWTSQRIKLS